MCFDFFSCFESYVVPIMTFEIKQKDPTDISKYYCKMTLKDHTEKNVILSSAKIMTLWDAMAPQIKRAVIFPSFFNSDKNARSHKQPQEIFDRIITGKYAIPTITGKINPRSDSVDRLLKDLYDPAFKDK